MIFSKIRLKITIVKTIAKTLEYSRLLFAFDSNAPMLPVGLHITSAATPDFHAKPRPVIQAFLKAGITTGNLMFIIIPFLFIPIIFAISISLPSTDKSAVSTCIQIIGKTIKKAIKEGIDVEGIQSHAKIINAATGTERISLDIGLVNVLKRELLPESIPQNNPRITAKIKPTRIFLIETKTASQKDFRFTQLINSLNISMGNGILKSRLLFAKPAAICHSRTQRKMDPAENNIFLKLTFIIEIVSR